MKTIKADLLLNIADAVAEDQAFCISVGPNGDPIVLTIQEMPDARYRLRIQHHAKDWLDVINLPELDAPFYFAQPLPPNQWLLVRRRTASSPGEDEHNAHIYSDQGRFVHSFAAGDGIQDVQTTIDGQIWVSYFDEGVVGGGELAANGLVCFNRQGEPMFRFRDIVSSEVSSIGDCYALNVAYKDEVWVCYYNKFPLLRIRRRQFDRQWTNLPTPLFSMSTFAVLRNHALFRQRGKETDQLSLLSLDTMETEEVRVVQANNEPLVFQGAFGRGFRMYLETDSALYAVDMNDLEE